MMSSGTVVERSHLPADTTDDCHVVSQHARASDRLLRYTIFVLLNNVGKGPVLSEWSFPAGRSDDVASVQKPATNGSN